MIKMVEENKYCIDVLHQSQAIQMALREVDHLMLENHLKKCAADAMGGREKEKAVAEVMSVFRKGG